MNLQIRGGPCTLTVRCSACLPPLGAPISLLLFWRRCVSSGEEPGAYFY